jgi:hypothetical protein
MITIIAASTYNRPDFIEFQYKSIQKHIKSDFKFIVVNNAKFSFIDRKKDSSELFYQIKEVCEKLNIDYYDVNICENTLKKATSGSIVNYKYTTDPYACNYSIQWTFENIISKIEGIVYIIDSDLFFINDVDLESELKYFDCGYIPQYRGVRQNSEMVLASVKYMWNMFCGFNTKRRSDLNELNWSLIPINDQPCDVGAHTHFFLQEKTDLKQIYFEEHAIYEIKKLDEDTIFIHYCINGNSNYHLELNSKFELKKFTCLERFCQNKTFEYELDYDDYKIYIVDLVKKIFNILRENIEDLPNPLRLGFVKKYDDFNFFGLHYRSSANYLDYSTDKYNLEKTELLKKIIQNS